MIVDFHSHTHESDGSLAPGQLVDLMRKRGVRIFAITDHDTTRAYGQFTADFARVVPGVEINTSWRDNEVHVLGYGVPTGNDGPLAETLAANRRFRRTRAERMVAAVNAAGFPITLDAVVAEADGADAIGRPHLAKALVRAGLIADVDTAFRTLLGRDKPGYIPSNNITPAAAIAAIAGCGGFPVLAHPGRLKDDKILDELAPQGLAGLEVFYPTHTPAQTAHFRAKAAHYGLVMTAGSDFHDPRWNARGVGMDVDEDDIGPFLELLGATV